MDINEMENLGVADYYLELTTYIRDFVDRNYPLSEEDMRALANDSSTDNVRRRQFAHQILTIAMKESLEKIALKNVQMMDEAQKGTYTPYTVSDFEKAIFGIKQYMLGRLWNEQNKTENLDLDKGETDQVRNPNSDKEK